MDEADRLLDMGFKKDIVKIVEELDKAKINSEYDPLAMLHNKKLDKEQTVVKTGAPLGNPNNKTRQTILLSATLNEGIAELANFTMKDHVYVDTLEDWSSIKADRMIIPDTVKQEFIVTYVKHKLFTLSALLLTKPRQKVFVFMATSQMVDYHYELFTRCLVKMPINRGKLTIDRAVSSDFDNDDDDEPEERVFDGEFFKLHGSMDQNVRKEVFTSFRAAKKGILLCTVSIFRLFEFV